MGLWVVAYTERVVRVCVALLLSPYREYRLWKVPPDIIDFAREVGLVMEVPLSSPANVREFLEFSHFIGATEFTAMPEQWRD